MISKQNVYLNGDRSRAVPEGDEDAKFLLVREGHSIEEGEAEKYDGALDLIGSAAKQKAAAPAPSTENKPARKAAKKAAKKAAR